MPLGAVLDTGYVMLTDDADPEARGLLETLFAADTEEEAEAAFADLHALSDWRQAQAKKAEAAMGLKDKPALGKRVAASELEQGDAEWTAIAEATQRLADEGGSSTALGQGPA